MELYKEQHQEMMGVGTKPAVSIKTLTKTKPKPIPSKGSIFELNEDIQKPPLMDGESESSSTETKSQAGLDLAKLKGALADMK